MYLKPSSTILFEGLEDHFLSSSLNMLRLAHHLHLIVSACLYAGGGTMVSDEWVDPFLYVCGVV